MAATLGMLPARCSFSPRLPSRRLLLNPPGVRRFPTACLRSSPSSPHLSSESTTDSPSASTTTTTQATGDLFLDANKHGEDRLSYQLSSDNGVSSVIPAAESTVEKLIFDFRFLALLAIGGSLGGSLLCFLNGCVYVVEAYKVYWTACIKGVHTGNMVLRLVEAIDVYLAGTVMLIFAMGLYGLFISNSPPGVISSLDRSLKGSSLFGMFTMKLQNIYFLFDQEINQGSRQLGCSAYGYSATDRGILTYLTTQLITMTGHYMAGRIVNSICLLAKSRAAEASTSGIENDGVALIVVFNVCAFIL